MSDQLAGFWYLRLCGHQYEVRDIDHSQWRDIVSVQDFEKERVDSVLHTIFKNNVMAFGNGKLGAVNGMNKAGQLEIVSLQSEEIWTGVTYGLSSTMIMEVPIDIAY